MDRAQLIESLPKVELHLHIEGSLEPAMVMDLAARHGVDTGYASAQALAQAYQFSNLQEFLDIYYTGANVLRTEADFEALTYAYFQRFAADKGIHAEIFFDPQTHTDRGIDFHVPLNGILHGITRAQRELGISAGLIMCFLRHLDEAAAFKTLEQALPFKDALLGVGLDSSELGHPPSKFARVFAAARAEGLKLFAHAGEEGPPDYIWEAIDVLGVDRIDHGNRCLEDVALVRRIRDDGLTLTICPLSNKALCVVDDLAKHPLKQMLDLGLRATINSDDPAYFGGYIGANWHQIAQALDLDASALKSLATNAISGSYMPKPQQAHWLAVVGAL